MSNSLGLVDFAIRLVNPVVNLPNGLLKYFEELNLQKNSEINSDHKKIGGGGGGRELVEMMFGLVKMTFFAPCPRVTCFQWHTPT